MDWMNSTPKERKEYIDKLDQLFYFDYNLIPDVDVRDINNEDHFFGIFPSYKNMDVSYNYDTTDLQEIIGFSGTNNWDDEDMFNVLLTLNNRDLCRDNWDNQKNGYGLVGAVSHLLNLPYNYVNIMFCVANDHDLIEYGTNLQIGWVTNKAKKVIKRRQSNLFRIEEQNYKEI